MTCGQQWPHGGMRDTFIQVCQHADLTRGNPEGMHQVLVGDYDRLAQQWARISLGEETTPVPNDRNDPRPLAPEPPPSPAQVEAIAKTGGMSTEEAHQFILKLRKFFEDTGKPDMVSALNDVFPEGGKVEVWG